MTIMILSRRMRLFFIFFLVLLGTSPSYASKFRAVVAGVTDYQGLLKSEPPLKLDVAAIKMREAIVKLASSRGFNNNDIEIMVLIDTNNNNLRPTSPNLLDAIQKIADLSSPDDELAVYFTGHGTSDYLFSSGANTNKLSTRVNINVIRNLVASSEAKTKILFFDTCQVKSSNFTLGVGSTLNIKGAFQEKTSNGTAWFFSAKHGQASYVDDKLGYGIFTKHLLAGLVEGLSDGWSDRFGENNLKDGSITDDELSAFLKSKVRQEVYEKFEEKQSPVNLVQGGMVLLRNSVIMSTKPASESKDDVKNPLYTSPPKILDFSNVLVTYYKKDADGDRITSLLDGEDIPFRIKKALIPDHPVNALACAPNSPIEAVKAIALAMVKRHIPLQKIYTFRNPSKKPKQIEIVSTLDENNGKWTFGLRKTLTSEQINSLKACPKRLFGKLQSAVSKQADSYCDNVDISVGTPLSAISAAAWCGSIGATRTTVQQASIDRTSSCNAYATQPFGNLTQNQLFSRSKELARDGEYDAAFELIHACQCHNPAGQALVSEGKKRIACWLRTQ